jgi:putative SOS response-associated peptidase YedK
MLTSPVEDIAEAFGVTPIPLGPPRFNIAPGQDLAVVRPARPSSSDSAPGPESRELALVRWGLVPWWSKDGKIASRCILARAETIARAPAFRDAFQSRRCLVVVDGFYEWSGTGKARRPYHVRLVEGGPFAIAGVWDSWKSPEGPRRESCAIVTTPARGPIQQLHDRMPLVLDRDERDLWLSASANDASGVVADAGAREERAEHLIVVPVSTWVNDVRHDDPHCLDAPAEPAGPAQTTLRFG